MIALDVPCPARTCRARPGEPCKTSLGLIRKDSHGLRWLNTLDGPLVRCAEGPCDACWWTGWEQA